MLMHRFDLMNNNQFIDSLFIIKSEEFNPMTFPDTVGAFYAYYFGEVEIDGS